MKREREYDLVIGLALFLGGGAALVIYVLGLFSPADAVMPMPTPEARGWVVDGQMALQTLDEREVVVVLPGSRIAVTHKSTLPAPTDTAVPAAVPDPVLLARISHYTPSAGPPSCHSSNWANGECTSWLADGNGGWYHWSHYAGWGLACPSPQFALGTRFMIEYFPSNAADGAWQCVDRGSAIVALSGGEYGEPTFFLDLLTDVQPYVSPQVATVVTDVHSPMGHYLVRVKIVD